MKKFDYAKHKEKKKKKFKMPVLSFYDDRYRVPIVLLPLGLIYIAKDRIHLKYVEHLEWDEVKASKVLDYFLPYVIEYDEDKNVYYYCTNWGYSRTQLSKRVPLRLKGWSKKYHIDVFKYLENGYQKKGFVKSFEKEWNERWIIFTPENN